MASPAEIVPRAPETLPADFSGWDNEDPPSTLPADSSDFNALPGFSVTPEPAAQRGGTRHNAASAVERPNIPPPLTPAAAFAEAEDFLKTFRPKYFDPEDLKPKPKRKSLSTNKTLLAAWGGASAVLLAILISLAYPKLTGKSAMARQSTVRQSAPVAQTTQAPAAAIPKPLASQPFVPAQETSNAPASEAALEPPPATAAENVPPPDAQSETMSEQLTAPARIPQEIKMAPAKDSPPSAGFGVAGMESLNGSGSGAAGNVFNSQAKAKVKVEPPKIVNVSAGVAVGMLIQKSTPVYPPIAKSARVSGTVVLQAIISKTGTIDDLHVISGPEMLREAALSAVRTWRYRPYMLNNQPIAVETTVNVIFSLNG
jgi:protein TonB